MKHLLLVRLVPESLPRVENTQVVNILDVALLEIQCGAVFLG